MHGITANLSGSFELRKNITTSSDLGKTAIDPRLLQVDSLDVGKLSSNDSEQPNLSQKFKLGATQ